MIFVLDASMALSWLFERQLAQERERAQAVLLSMAEANALVPALWHLEIANALLVAERRKIISEARAADYLGRLYRLPTTTDDAAPAVRREVVMALAREHGLSAYDAVYLDLALRKGAALATFDARLSAAMGRAGGVVL